ncbi:hypothetical protein [Paenibacillus polymyxa]
MAPVNMAPVNPAPPQLQPIITQTAPPQQMQPIVTQPIVTQPIAPKPQLPINIEKQPVTEKFCGCTSSKPMENSSWPLQQPTFDYSPPINAMPNSLYPGIGSPQNWGNAPVNTSFAEHASPTVVADQGYHHDCEHPWCWGPVQTAAPIHAHPTPYPAYSDCCCTPGYYPSHEASENTSYPVYPPFIHQGGPQQQPESAVQSSQWGNAWGGPQYSMPASGYVSDFSQPMAQHAANHPYHPFAHGNAPMYPLEGYTTPYMFMPDCGCREGNIESAPASPGTQEVGNNLTIPSQNEGASSKKDNSASKGKSKDNSSSTSKEETSKAKVSSEHATVKKHKSRKSTGGRSRSSSYSARARQNPWIND